MTADSESVIDVDEIETSVLDRDKVLVRVVGRWRGKRRAPDARAFLVVESDGRRHRFPAMPEPRRSRFGRPGQWGASFAVPAWLEPRLGPEMSLWIGNSCIPLPTLDEPGSATVEHDEVAPTPAESDSDVAADFEGESELRGELADTRAQLADLQDQLSQLTSARSELEEEIGHLRTDLARSTVAREAAESEAAGLRSEIDRLGGALAAARGSADTSTGLQEAQRLLQEARALTARLRAPGAPGSPPAGV